MTLRSRTLLSLVAILFTVFIASACGSRARGPRPSGDGLDVSSIPTEYRGDYALFAQRCSKCHSLARPLDNGHLEDRFWELYVERMRRQPGSGIAPEDVPSILRFLHYYSSATAAVAPAGAK